MVKVFDINLDELTASYTIQCIGNMSVMLGGYNTVTYPIGGGGYAFGINSFSVELIKIVCK